MDRLFEFFRGLIPTKQETKGLSLVYIAEEARANGIPLEPKDFGYDLKTGETTGQISLNALNNLIIMGRESGVLSPKEINYLEEVSKTLV